MGGNLFFELSQVNAHPSTDTVLFKYSIWVWSLFCLDVKPSQPKCLFVILYFLSINTCTSYMCADMPSCVKLIQWLFWVFFPLITISGIPCTNHAFKCRNNICIRKQYARCDGTVDCVDGSDERSCSKFLSNIHLSELWTFYTIKTLFLPALE